MQKISFSCVVVIFFLKCHINALSIFYPSYYYVAYSCGIWIHERKGIFSYRYIFLLFIKVIYNSNLFIYYLYIVILLIFYCGVLFCLTVRSDKYPWIFLKKLYLSDVMYSTIDHWILNFEVWIQTLMGRRGCIPFTSSDHDKSPFLSLFYNLQILHLHASSTYLPAAASFPKGQQIRYCASNSSYSFSFVLIRCPLDF